MLWDYGSLLPERRNILRLMFLDPRVRAAQTRGRPRGVHDSRVANHTISD
jgi:hypothetical protein